MLEQKDLITRFNKKNYSYKLHKHEPLFTVEDSLNKRQEIEGAHSKNLFFKNKQNKFFLFSCLETTKIDLKKLAKNLNLGNISFAREEYLKKYLGVLPGSVTPFGLLNDNNQKVEFYLDKAFLAEKSVNFHPLVNTSTVNLAVGDFISFLIENKKKVNIFNFEDYTLIDK